MTGDLEGEKFDPALLDVLVCPLTRGPLLHDAARNRLVSEQAGVAFPIENGIPVLLEDRAERTES